MSIPPESTASGDLPKKPPRSLISNLVFWGSVSTLAVFLLSVTVVPWAIGAYDDSHRDRIECNVTDATGGTYSPAGRTVGSRPDLTISTSDCGRLSLLHGFDQATNDAMAEELAQGGKFEFEIGKATWALQGLFHAVGMNPTVFSYENIG